VSIKFEIFTEFSLKQLSLGLSLGLTWLKFHKINDSIQLPLCMYNYNLLEVGSWNLGLGTKTNTALTSTT